MALKKNYHKLYLSKRDELDKNVINLVVKKEEIICSAPYNNPLLKYTLSGIRRYKSGKIRILYVLSDDKKWHKLWIEACGNVPENLEILFLFVDLRSDDTYKGALKFLRRNNIL